MLHVCVSATLYRPLDENYAPEEDVSVEKIEKELKDQVYNRMLNLYMFYIYIYIYIFTINININIYIECSTDICFIYIYIYY